MTAPAGDDPMRQTRTFPAATPSSPRVLKSADEAPCGSLWARMSDGWLVLRMSDGSGRMVPKEYEGQDTRWEWQAARQDFPARIVAEGLTEAECRHLSGLSAQEAIAWCEVRAKRPQPGDEVPWAEMEDGALYFDTPGTVPFVGRHAGRWHWVRYDGEGLGALLSGLGSPRTSGPSMVGSLKATLVARDLGTDPEAWRRAMREWTANGNKPSKPDLSSMTAAQAAEHLNRTQGHVGTLAAVDPSRVVITIDGHRITGFAPEFVRVGVGGFSVAPAPKRAKRPQPGDVVPWAKVENGCLYARTSDQFPFHVITGRRHMTMAGPDDKDLPRVVAGTPVAPAPAANDALDPLRARLSERNGVDLATYPPERVVDLALERIEADRREIERLKNANAEARRALETPGRQGLRARLAKAEAALAELPKTPSWARVRIASLEAEAVTRRAALEKAEAERDDFRKRLASLWAERDSLQLQAARSVDALTAQRDEARRALADEKVKTTRLEREVAGGHAAQDALCRVATACGVRSGTWAELATGVLAEVARLRGLLDARTGSDATALVKPLRLTMGWSWPSDTASTPGQVVEAAAKALQVARSTALDLNRGLFTETERRRTAEAGAGQATMLLNAWQRWARPLWPEGPPNPADAALRCAIEGRVKDADARAEKAERNLRAAADLLAA